MLTVSKVLYNLFIKLYYVAAVLIKPFNSKAGKWVDGRKAVFEELETAKLHNTFWFHCASLGEFEQARPLIEAVKSSFPNNEIVLTFFSPSGYDIVKRKGLVKHVFYLPHDSKANAKKFINTIKPVFAVFVKYEFWYHYLSVLQQQKIQTILISALFRSNSVFFKWYGQIFRKMLGCYSHIFVQDEKSMLLLKQIGQDRITISGDTRFDRVLAIKDKGNEHPLAKEFKQGKKIFIAGSTWPQDEEHILRLAKEWSNNDQIKFLIAPHEIEIKRIKRIIQALKPRAIPYSEADMESIGSYDILVIDSIGMLAQLYKYGDIAYIGGGFNAGIHNILEASANGLPVIFGPGYQKFNEAVELIDTKGASSIKNYADLKSSFEDLMNDSHTYEEARNIAATYVVDRAGATEIIIKYIKRKLING